MLSKNEYTEPKVLITLFDNEDIVTTSDPVGNISGGGDNDLLWNDLFND